MLRHIYECTILMSNRNELCHYSTTNTVTLTAPYRRDIFNEDALDASDFGVSKEQKQTVQKEPTLS